MNKRKIEAMHEVYGKKEGAVCRDCVNCIRVDWRDRHYRKCTAYGVKCSEATDWVGKFPACELFGKEFISDKERKPLIEQIKRQREVKEVVPDPNQGSLF